MPDSDPLHDDPAVRRRDRGLRRVGVVTAAVLTTAAAGTAILGAAYRSQLPGTASSPATAPTSGAQTPQSGTLRPPAQAPAPVAPPSQAPSATSGAS
ncbi:hypothetical protein AB0D10_31290 [Kitasatospora sp. NPDC048545]|uniref:hypothetical protein n=1 Tax=Kitasatospora sp. NPDC048545 TaxID=3157208 RepID=UPI00340A1ACE